MVTQKHGVRVGHRYSVLIPYRGLVSKLPVKYRFILYRYPFSVFMNLTNPLSSLNVLRSLYIRPVGYNPLICIVMQISFLFINVYCEVMLINEMQQMASTCFDFQ
jgi:hypothetical protein